VLTEGDDQQDPVADAARAILDGHIVLSRRLAESGVYPAIDVEASISRVMPQIISPLHLEQAQQFKSIYSLYRQNQDLINVGAYTMGNDPNIDEAITLFPSLQDLLKQGMNEAVDWQTSLTVLQQTMQQPSSQMNFSQAPTPVLNNG
jgi:flagellum-specific ATP synthase